jgi:phosphatidylserine/phosphatidylglycerophosphate/cardiolipin synthase-like enzyme
MISSLLALPEYDLAALTAALRTRRLAAPFSAVAIERLLGHGVTAQCIEAIEELHRMCFSEELIATALELVLQDRQRRPRMEDVIDLVTSGPEARGVTNRDTRVVVRELFAHAQASVLVAGYAVYQGQKVFEALAERMLAIPHLAVRMFLDIQRGPGDTSAPSELVRRFGHTFRNQQWPHDRPYPQLFYDPRSVAIAAPKRASLHAKCIVVDNRAIFVSSANFTEAAQERNLEIGLLIHSASLAERLTRHFDTLLSEQLLQPVG